jgi:A/G-specific adenine glycosylase
VSTDCRARALARPEDFPIKSRRASRHRRASDWLWLTHRNRIWLLQRPESGVWAGLWCMPELAQVRLTAVSGGAPAQEPAVDTPPGFVFADSRISTWPGSGRWLDSVEHALTHFDWVLRPLRWELPDDVGLACLAKLLAPWPAGQWFNPDQALALGLPAPIRRWLETP